MTEEEENHLRLLVEAAERTAGFTRQDFEKYKQKQIEEKNKEVK